jgi:hypothetical protein
VRYPMRLLPAIAAVTLAAALAPAGGTTPVRAAAGPPTALRWDVPVSGTFRCADGREFPQYFSSPAIGDLRGDGKREIVAGFPDGQVRVFDTSGRVIWFRDTGDDIAASPTLADLDHNGRLSVIVGSYNGSVWVWDADGNQRPGWPQHSQFGTLGGPTAPGFFSSVAVGDVFGDGRMELFSSALDLRTYGWFSDGTPFPGFPHTVYDSALATPALADLEHAHHLDIVTPSDTTGGDIYHDPAGGVYWVWSPNGGLLSKASVDETPWASPAIENFGDGNFTIVNGTGDNFHQTSNPNAGRYIVGLNQDGSTRPGFPSPTGAAIFAGPSVGDLLGDGQREIAVVSEDGMVHVVNGQGSALFGTPFHVPFSQTPAGFYHGGSIIAPVDTPGRNGLWVQGGPNIYGYDVVGGSLQLSVTIPTNGVVFSTPAVGDLGDGTLGIAVTSDEQQNFGHACNNSGVWHLALYTLTQAGSSLPAGAWPTFHGNNNRSGSNLGLGPRPNHGYWMVASDGGIFPFGNAGGFGSTGNIRLNQPIVGMAKAPHDDGYWLVASDGGIFPFGPGAGGYGSTGNIRLNQPIVGMAATPTGHGYWMVASDGGMFPFGDAGGFGSTGNIRLNKPIVGMASTPAGDGYWLVASDGGIFPFGPGAGGYGSTGNIRLNQPIVGMAATPTGHGYWLVASDGGIFPFGDAGGFGSTGGIRLNKPIVAMTVAPGGQGYYLVASDGGIFPFGAGAGGYGSLGNIRLNQPIVGMAATN